MQSSQQFLSSSFTRQHQKHLMNLVLAHSSFMIEGPRGCGKTTFIQHLLETAKYPYIKINSILGEKKHNFIKILWTQFKKLFNYVNANQIVSLQGLARSMELLKKQVPEQLFKKVASHGVIYIFIDNMEQLHVNQKFLSTIFSFKQNIDIKIAYIFAGINANSRLMLYERPICDIINIIMPKPDKAFIKSVVIHHLQPQFDRQINSLRVNCETALSINQNTGLAELMSQLDKGSKLLDAFTTHIVEGIFLIQSDLDHIKTLSVAFLKKLLQKYQQILIKFSPLPNSKSKPQKNDADKIRLARILNDPAFKNFFNKVCEYGSENAWIVSKKQQEETIEDQYFEKKVFYPELIKTSIYFAQVCPQGDDYRRFKQYKRTTKRPSQMKSQKMKIKKHNPFRIISICESLQSQTRMVTKQRQYHQHSMDFYTCFQHLYEQGDIRFVGKSGAFGLGKIQSRTNEQDATQLLKNMDLKMDQFKS